MGCGDPRADCTTTNHLAKEFDDGRGSRPSIFSILAGGGAYFGGYSNSSRSNNNNNSSSSCCREVVDLKLGSWIPHNNSSGGGSEGFLVQNNNNNNSNNNYYYYNNHLMQPPYSTSTTSSSSGGGGSARRSRASGGAQVASCLVDGCKSDLSKCRDYHRRHKVCELHSKTPRVTINGLEQRFCQQCSRFHSLGEFDEGKRSCRKRLEGHNRRRRKPQPDALSINPANFLSTGRAGGRFLPFSSSSPIIPVVSSAWSAGPMKPESSSTALYTPTHHHHSQLNNIFGGGSNRCYTPPTTNYRGRQFPFLQGPDSSSSTPSTPPINHNNNNNVTTAVGDSSSLNDQSSHHHHNHHNSSNNGRGPPPHNLFCDNANYNSLSGAQVIDSTDRALSLLSSSSSHGENAAAAATGTATAAGIGFSRLIQQQQQQQQQQQLHHHNTHHHHHHHHHPMNHHQHLVSGLTYNAMPGTGHYPCSSPSSQVLDASHHHNQAGPPNPAGPAFLNMSTTAAPGLIHCQDVFQASASEGSASSASGPHQTLSFSWE